MTRISVPANVTTPAITDKVPMASVAQANTALVLDIPQIVGFAGVGYLSAAPSATDTTIDVKSLPTGVVANAFWAVIDPYTIECEIRKVTGIATLALTVAALDYAHAIDDPVFFVTAPVANVKWFGAVGDGSTDDLTAFNRMFASGVKEFYIPEDTYELSQYVHLDTLTNITVRGGKGSIIQYSSDDTGLATDATATTDTQVRSAFLLNTCTDVRFEGLSFQGATNANDTDNLGAAVYGLASSYVHLVNCTNDDGGRLFFSDNNASSFGNRLINCVSRDAVNFISMGREFGVSDCYFEQNDAAGYDSPNTTHCLYQTAFHGKAKIANNYFKNYRTNAIKISGSAGAVSHYSIVGNTFDDCARAIEFGADDVQRHDSCKIIGNDFINCATNKTNWNEGEAIRIWGSTGVVIAENNFYYDRNNIISPTGRYAIRVTGTSASNQAAEDILISGNSFVGTATPGSTLASAVYAANVGWNATDYGSIIIKDNILQNMAATGIITIGCMGLKVHGNEVRGMSVLWNDEGSSVPVCVENRIHNSGTSNAKLRINNTSWPIIRDNLSFEKTLGARSMVGVPANAGTGIVDHPLLGYKGRAVPLGASEGEVVFAFGYGWANGDTITVQGTTHTYGAANDFTTSAGLIALIDAQSNIDCVDYGNPWSITTAHIRVRSTGGIAITASTTNPTACIFLPNDTTVSNRMQQRGSGIGDTVVWSPLVSHESAVILFPDNAAAATLLAAGSYSRDTPGANDAGVAIMSHDNAAGTEQFGWAVV